MRSLGLCIIKARRILRRTGYIEGILEGIKEDLVQNVDEKSYRCHIKHD